MQWPPTKPGLKSKKFHLVAAALRISFVFKFNLSKIIDNSLIKPTLISRWQFSITFAASAISMLGAL